MLPARLDCEKTHVFNFKEKEHESGLFICSVTPVCLTYNPDAAVG